MPAFICIDEICNIHNLQKNERFLQLINYNAIDSKGDVTMPHMWLIDLYHSIIIKN